LRNKSVEACMKLETQKRVIWIGRGWKRFGAAHATTLRRDPKILEKCRDISAHRAHGNEKAKRNASYRNYDAFEIAENKALSSTLRTRRWHRATEARRAFNASPTTSARRIYFGCENGVRDYRCKLLSSSCLERPALAIFWMGPRHFHPPARAPAVGLLWQKLYGNDGLVFDTLNRKDLMPYGSMIWAA